MFILALHVPLLCLAPYPLACRLFDLIIVVWDSSHTSDAAYAHYTVHVPVGSLAWVKRWF